MTRPLLLVVACFACLVGVPAETYPVRVTLRGSSQPAEASAVCVGKSETQSLFLTNRHVAQGAVQLFVANGQRWVEARGIRLSQTADEASFHVKHTSFKITPLMTGLPRGHRVDVCGYSNRSRFCFTGRYNGNNIDAIFGANLCCCRLKGVRAARVQHQVHACFGQAFGTSAPQAL